jgi:hypothetical protein
MLSGIEIFRKRPMHLHPFFSRRPGGISYCGGGMIPCRALAVVESRTPGSGGSIPSFIPNISR